MASVKYPQQNQLQQDLRFEDFLCLNPSSAEDFTVTEKTNFSTVMRNKRYFFLVLLKRSRRERRQRTPLAVQTTAEIRHLFSSLSAPSSLLHLVRDQNTESTVLEAGSGRRW
ncbi:unnamed protein product [Linum trigynum]|uniref:Uncharacterized protein n=1 Tax=Linum trigynum TaxID=586398 RepID=A0AAV2CWZ4_9ROSI